MFLKIKNENQTSVETLFLSSNTCFRNVKFISAHFDKNFLHIIEFNGCAQIFRFFLFNFPSNKSDKVLIVVFETDVSHF